MCSTQSFYGSGRGDSLIDPRNYPPEIQEYLQGEERLLAQRQAQFDRLIEIGCMEGRYLDWCIKRGKRYLGIDVIQRYIEAGRKRLARLGLAPPDYQLVVSPAEEIHRLLKNNSRERLLLFFPFNSFGNMGDPQAVLGNVVLTKQPFLICSYQTSQKVNSLRLVYYENCGYQQVRCAIDGKGVRFISSEGLNTVAYHPSYLHQVCQILGIELQEIVFSKIGIAYQGAIK